MTKEIDSKMERFDASLNNTLKKMRKIEKTVDKLEMQIVAFFHSQTALNQVKEDNMEKEHLNMNKKIEKNTDDIDVIHEWKEDVIGTLAEHGAKIGVTMKISIGILISVLGILASIWVPKILPLL